jgi:hypothetical protein
MYAASKRVKDQRAAINNQQWFFDWAIEMSARRLFERALGFGFGVWLSRKCKHCSADLPRGFYMREMPLYDFTVWGETCRAVKLLV